MPALRTLSASEQTAAYLRRELHKGRWTGFMPGVSRLRSELGVNHKTVEAALRQLEQEGVLQSRGPGRRRQISLRESGAPSSVRIAIMEHDPSPVTAGYMVELQHLLLAAGHSVFFSDQTLVGLGMNLHRIQRVVLKTPADAWLVCAGSREVLQWFSVQAFPSFALFGRREGLPIASTGPNKVPACAAAVRHLVRLGHRRIVLIVRRIRRYPELGLFERAFVNELQRHKVPFSSFNLPDWEESREGFHELLRSLFRVTPPTALIIDEAPFFVAAQQYMAGRGIRVPQQVSMICTDADPAFEWCSPPISHICWDSGPVVRRVVRWAAAVSRGVDDRRHFSFPAEFVEGGTTGPASTM